MLIHHGGQTGIRHHSGDTGIADALDKTTQHFRQITRHCQNIATAWPYLSR
jgi:hypothetical protein